VAANEPFSDEPPSTEVVYEAVDPHTVRVRTDGKAGFIVVLDGYHPGWTAEDASGAVPLLRANGRYRAVYSPGGSRVFTLRYRPAWRLPALAASGLGLLLVIALAFGRSFSVSDYTGRGHGAC
jgi:hypothetical protein